MTSTRRAHDAAVLSSLRPAVGALVALLAAAPAPPAAAAVDLVSKAGAPLRGSGGALLVALDTSADGRYSVFASTGRLVPGQTGPTRVNLFLHDSLSGALTLISHVSDQPTTGANGDSDVPSISADGRFVAFRSDAPDLVGGSGGTTWNVYLFDRVTGSVTLVSHAPGNAGERANGPCDTGVAISADGAYVAFASVASNLVPGDPMNFDVFLYERATGTVTLVSHADGAPGTPGNGNAWGPSLSTDGAWLSFVSYATDHVAGTDLNGGGDVFLYERATGAITLVSHASGAPNVAANGGSPVAALSGDAGRIAFESAATDLVVGGDINGLSDVFVFERAGGTVRLASHAAGLPNDAGNGSATNPRISLDGAWVAFESTSSDMILGGSDFNGQADVFVFDAATGDVTLASHVVGLPGMAASGESYLGGPYPNRSSLSGNGAFVAFASDAPDVAGGPDGNGAADVFLYDRTNDASTLVSHAFGAATPGSHGSYAPLISTDGTHVLYLSDAVDLTADPDGSGAVIDAYLFSGGVNTRLSQTPPTPLSISGAGSSYAPLGVSADGRYVVYVSEAVNLVPGQIDTNAVRDVFLHDRLAGTTTLVSHADGAPDRTGNGDSFDTAISADGNWIAFVSRATDLVAGTDTAGSDDVFLYERATGLVTLVSHLSGSPAAAAGRSGTPFVSDDGGWVAFESESSGVVAGSDSNGVMDVFLWSRATNTSLLASHAAGAPTTAGNGRSYLGPAPRGTGLSAGGNALAFSSTATNLVTGSDTNGREDVFLFDRTTGLVTLVSHATSGPTTTGNGGSNRGVISVDGAWVAFMSLASNLISGSDTNSSYDVFLIETASGIVRLVSHTSASPTTAGNGASLDPVVSGDAAFVTFKSSASNLVAGSDFNSTFDVFLYARAGGALTLVSHVPASPTTAGGAASQGPVISRDGSSVAFVSNATDLVAGLDTNGSDDAFAFDRATGAVALLSHTPAGRTGARFTWGVALDAAGVHACFASLADDLVAGDLNAGADVFVATRPCAPSPPAALGVVAGGPNRIDLNWSGGGGPYDVYRRGPIAADFERITTTGAASFSDTGVAGGVFYEYYVANACGATNAVFGTTTGTCELAPPFAGANAAWLQAGATCAVAVHWEPLIPAFIPCTGDVAYDVHRADAPGLLPSAATRIAAGVTAPPYIDTAGLQANTTYYYLVRARHDLNRAEDDNLVWQAVNTGACSATPPAPVEFFDARAGAAAVRLNWVDPVAGYDSTRVLVRTDTYPVGPFDPLATLVGDFPGAPADVVEVPHAPLPDDTTHYYAAFAQDAFGAFAPPLVTTFGYPRSTAGNAKWSYTTGAAALSIPGVTPNNTYVVQSNDRVMHALAPGVSGGAWRAGWRPTRLGAPAGGRPLVLNLPLTSVKGTRRLIITAAQDGRVYALNADDGAPLWTSPVLAPMIVAAPSAMLTDFGGAYNLVFVGTRDAVGINRMYALRLADGSIAWSFEDGPLGPGVVGGQAALDVPNKRLYFASRGNLGFGDTVWALSFTDTGAVKLWSANVGDVDGAVTLRAGKLYVGTNGSEVHAFDAVSGAALWAAPYNAADGPVKGFIWPESTSSRLYFSTTNGVHAIQDDGASASSFWAAPVAIANASPPLLRGGRAYVGGGSSRVYSIDATSPTPAPPNTVVLGDPLVPKVLGPMTLDVPSGLLLMGSDQGVIYSLALPF